MAWKYFARRQIELNMRSLAGERMSWFICMLAGIANESWESRVVRTNERTNERMVENELVIQFAFFVSWAGLKTEGRNLRRAVFQVFFFASANANYIESSVQVSPQSQRMIRLICIMPGLVPRLARDWRSLLGARFQSVSLSLILFTFWSRPSCCSFVDWLAKSIDDWSDLGRVICLL